MERLQADVARLRGEIISGQKRLFEPPEPEAVAPEEETYVIPVGSGVIEEATFERIKTFCRKRGHAATSEIVHEFNVGPSFAMKLIDAMDAQGLLEAADGAGPRKFKEQNA